MLRASKAFRGKYPTQNQMILSKTLQITPEISVSCGFDVNLRFKPVLLISQSTSGNRKEEIKILMTEWFALIALKNHIHLQLSTVHKEGRTEEPFTIFGVDSAVFAFKFSTCTYTSMVIRQYGWEVDIDVEDWTKFMDKKDMIDGFFLWSEYARDSIYQFYIRYLRKCLELNVVLLTPEQYSSILIKDKNGFYQRLCVEFEKNMKCRLEMDINKAMNN